MNIPMFWWRDANITTNFGDVLSPYIVEQLSGRTPQYTQLPGKLLACGSVMDMVKEGDVIWGTGISKPNETYRCNMTIHAVRGPRTRKNLLMTGLDCPSVYGDPAILLPHLFNVKTTKKYKYGIIPHYVDYEQVKKTTKETDIHIIDIMSGIENVILEAHQCEYLFSSSLHGVILGDVFKIPTRWVIISDKVSSKTFKFLDYYESTNRDLFFIDWRKRFVIDNVFNNWSPPDIDCNKLLSVFPYLKSEIKTIDDIIPKEIKE